MTDYSSDWVAQHDHASIPLNKVKWAHSRLRVQSALVLYNPATLALGDTFRFFTLDSGWLLDRILVSVDSIPTSASTDTGFGLVSFGLWTTQGAMVDEDLFNNASNYFISRRHLEDIRSQITPNSRSLFQGDTLQMEVWELLGLARDPHATYELRAHVDNVDASFRTEAWIRVEMHYRAGD